MSVVEEVTTGSEPAPAGDSVPQVSMEHIMSEMDRNPAMKEHMHQLLESLPKPEPTVGLEPGDSVTV